MTVVVITGCPLISVSFSYASIVKPQLRSPHLPRGVMPRSFVGPALLKVRRGKRGQGLSMLLPLMRHLVAILSQTNWDYAGDRYVRRGPNALTTEITDKHDALLGAFNRSRYHPFILQFEGQSRTRSPRQCIRIYYSSPESKGLLKSGKTTHSFS
jgi:hypothetical protein